MKTADSSIDGWMMLYIILRTLDVDKHKRINHAVAAIGGGHHIMIAVLLLLAFENLSANLFDGKKIV